MLMDNFYISDGWRYARNPGGIQIRPGQWFTTTTSTTAKSSGSDGSSDRTPGHASLRPSNISSVLLNVDVKNIHWLVIKISLVRSPRSSIRLKNPLTQMHGSVPSSPNLHYSPSHVPKQIRLSSQPNSSVVLLAFGGTTTMPCNRMDILSLGKNLRPPLGHTISRKDSLSESSMNFWHLHKEATLYFNTHRLSTTCASTRAIMLTRTPRKEIGRGLNTKLKERLNLVRADNFNELVNMAITQEDCILAHRAEKRQKVSTGPSNAQPSRYRLIQNPVSRTPPRNVPTSRWVARPPQQPRFNRPPVPQPQQQ
jgi:hypothetical protein